MTKKPNGYWQSLETAIAEARQAIQKEGWGSLPSKKELEKNGYISLSVAITRYHGGLNQFRTKLGQKNFQKPKGYWLNEKNTITEVRQMMKEQGWTTLPSKKELRKHGYTSLSVAITRYHGGLNQFRTKLGQKNFQKPKGYWQKLENVLTEIKQAMQTQNWHILPSDKQLRKHRYSSLNHAIRYHGGMHIIREKLGQQNTKKPLGYWQKLENTIAEAKQAMSKHNWNTLPSPNQLRKYGYNSLNMAISKYYGGLNAFRTTLGQKNPDKKPNGYWKSLENTLAEAQQAMKQHGWDTLPSHRQLQNQGCSALSHAIIRHHRGYFTFRTLLTEHITGKTQKQQLEEMLDEYIAA